MFYRKVVVLLSLFLLPAGAGLVYAGDSTEAKTPVAVLVQLSSEHNRITALTAAKKYKELEEVKKDASGVRNAMIKDFQDHFSFCPVYYFVDTNVDLIKQKKFDGILLNAEGTPVKNPIVDSTSKKYIIAYYGYPSSQSKSNQHLKNRGSSVDDRDEPRGRGLVILNAKYIQVSYFYILEPGFGGHGPHKNYSYVSRHFDIEYYPLSDQLNYALNKRFEQIKFGMQEGDDVYDKQ